MKTYWVNVRKDRPDEVSHWRAWADGMPYVCLYFRKKDALKERGKYNCFFKPIKIILSKGVQDEQSN